jgi:LmeA-like phospholipid-binding
MMRRATLMRVTAAATLAVLAVLSLVGDRLAAHLAGTAVAHRLACAAGLDRTPAVTMGGFPFLTQALAGRYTDVDVLARDVRHGDLVVDTVHANLRGVSTSGHDGVRAAHVGVDVTVAYRALPAEVSGRHLAYRPAGGMLAVSTTASLRGIQVPVTVFADVAISDDRLVVTPREIEVLSLRTGAGSLLQEVPDLSRQLPALPAGLRYRSVRAAADGLHVSIGGDDVTAAPTTVHCGGSR